RLKAIPIVGEIELRKLGLLLPGGFVTESIRNIRFQRKDLPAICGSDFTLEGNQPHQTKDQEAQFELMVWSPGRAHAARASGTSRRSSRFIPGCSACEAGESIKPGAQAPGCEFAF
ncbi:MAG TPA: hypothetical protein VF088_17185, partial [Pyrinomonadaceae bacterium]